MKKRALVPFAALFLVALGINGCSKSDKVQVPKSTYPAPVPAKGGATNFSGQNAS